MINVVLYGFGNISHALISELKSEKFKLSVLTKSIDFDSPVEIVNIKTKNKGIAHIYKNPTDCLKDADYLIFCVPSYIRRAALENIKKIINPNTILGALPGTSGFNNEVKEILPNNKKYFSTQRVPFIARIIEKGKLVDSVAKKKTFVAISDYYENSIINDLKLLLGQSIEILSDFDLINLTNSNPLLHTARIYEFLIRKKQSLKVDESEMFYENWNDKASEILINMDSEFQQIIKAKGLQTPTILNHYDVKDAQELTRKLINIPAFKGIKFPMKLIDGENLIDFSSRYFMEDFELGLRYTIEQGLKEGVCVKTMLKVLSVYEFALKKSKA